MYPANFLPSSAFFIAVSFFAFSKPKTTDKNSSNYDGDIILCILFLGNIVFLSEKSCAEFFI